MGPGVPPKKVCQPEKDDMGGQGSQRLDLRCRSRGVWRMGWQMFLVVREAHVVIRMMHKR